MTRSLACADFGALASTRAVEGTARVVRVVRVATDDTHLTRLRLTNLRRRSLGVPQAVSHGTRRADAGRRPHPCALHGAQRSRNVAHVGDGSPRAACESEVDNPDALPRRRPACRARPRVPEQPPRPAPRTRVGRARERVRARGSFVDPHQVKEQALLASIRALPPKSEAEPVGAFRGGHSLYRRRGEFALTESAIAVSCAHDGN